MERTDLLCGENKWRSEWNLPYQDLVSYFLSGHLDLIICHPSLECFYFKPVETLQKKAHITANFCGLICLIWFEMQLQRLAGISTAWWQINRDFQGNCTPVNGVERWLIPVSQMKNTFFSVLHDCKMNTLGFRAIAWTKQGIFTNKTID